MKTTSNNNNDNINKTIDGYNADALDTYMKSLLGAEGWERHKPTRNINDYLTRRSNDNREAV